MAEHYFTDREFGERPRVAEEIDVRLWGGFRSLIVTRLDDASFGMRFPEVCSDLGGLPCGCDWRTFSESMLAEVPGSEWPLRADEKPQTFVVLDLLEFCADSVGRPVRGTWHDFMRHYHLTWEREPGLTAFVNEVNRLLTRNGVAFEMTSAGKVQRVLPDPLRETLIYARFKTGDTEADWLLETARTKIMAPAPDDRRDGLEKLWDAYERVKTLTPGLDKRQGIEALMNASARPGSKLHAALMSEAAALTTIGNSHRIRHAEIGQEPLETAAQVDYLFTRLFAFVYLVLKATNRAA